MKRTVKFMLLGFASMAFLAGCGSGGGGGDSSGGSGGDDEGFKPATFTNPNNVKYEYTSVALEDDRISGKFAKIGYYEYDCNKLTAFLNSWGQKGWKLFDIVEDHWLFIHGKSTTYNYVYDTYPELDSNYRYSYNSMLKILWYYNTRGADGYERVNIYHSTCAFYEKDVNSDVKIDFIYDVSYDDYDELLSVINKEGKNGYQFYSTTILSNGYNFATLKRYSNTANETFQSEYQDFVAYGSSGAKNLLSQLNEEADKGYLFKNNLSYYEERYSGSMEKVAMKALYLKHLSNTQKVVYKYLDQHTDITDLVNKLNAVGAEGGLLSHYRSLSIYNDNLALDGVLETKTAIGYNLDCSSGSCIIIY
jgi:hypothetical protein